MSFLASGVDWCGSSQMIRFWMRALPCVSRASRSSQNASRSPKLSPIVPNEFSTISPPRSFTGFSM